MKFDVHEYGYANHRSLEYKRGLRQLRSWHEQCRRRKLGLDEKAREAAYERKKEKNRERWRKIYAKKRAAKLAKEKEVA